ncbi:hypothetical protein DDE18_04595 [Nocardioides gansuensis]|uniref:Cupin domain-containing protein n=1 Tax=Nocardioides gansuensis TaxID=2138300 RepID=A0A2T8FD31_9ACTN|nr:hypothetical protein DDE18_04595 [Nocardioides gansuensis]
MLFQFPDQSHPEQVSAVRVDHVPEDLPPGAGVLAELWSAPDASYHDGRADPLVEVDAWRISCPPGASRFRTSLFSAGRETAMHRTSTLDYDFVLQGSVTLILDDGSETHLHAGDAVILPGTAHAWRAGPEGCRLGVVMIGTEPPPRGDVTAGALQLPVGRPPETPATLGR